MSVAIDTMLYASTPNSITAILDFLNDEEVDLRQHEINAWEALRKYSYDEVPLPSNILMHLLYSNAEEILTGEKYEHACLVVDFDVNAEGSSFTIGGVDIIDVDQINEFTHPDIKVEDEDKDD